MQRCTSRGELFHIHGYVSSDRTDYNTLIPVLEKHRKAFEVYGCADCSGCEHNNRQIRSIQTEGDFGDIKENEDFRRFNYRRSEKVYKEFMLYAIGRNINKYHRFVHGELQKFEGKTEQKSA